MPLLKLENIYKSYDQGGMELPILKNINLTIERGEYVAIMGPSGSGKSTLMNIIGCLDKPTEGKYYLLDTEISEFNDKKLSAIRNSEIGFVFQNFNLMPRSTALQNVELPLQYANVPKSERRPRCEEALKKVGLEERMTFKPTQLSGGQKQRVAIARAIVNHPSILLADEPTGALDYETGKSILKLLQKLSVDEGMTVVIITHNSALTAMANRVIRLKNGKVVSNTVNESPKSIDLIEW